jgi:hypothetical protein
LIPQVEISLSLLAFVLDEQALRSRKKLSFVFKRTLAQFTKRKYLRKQ